VPACDLGRGISDLSRLAGTEDSALRPAPEGTPSSWWASWWGNKPSRAKGLASSAFEMLIVGLEVSEGGIGVGAFLELESTLPDGDA